MLPEQYERSEQEIEGIISETKTRMERLQSWHVCTIGDRKVLVPDTSRALHDDVFGVHGMECTDPDPNLIVSAWPLKYIENYRLMHEFTRQMRYGDVDFNLTSIHPGVIEGNEVKRWAHEK